MSFIDLRIFFNNYLSLKAVVNEDLKIRLVKQTTSSKLIYEYLIEITLYLGINYIINLLGSQKRYHSFNYLSPRGY